MVNSIQGLHYQAFLTFLSHSSSLMSSPWLSQVLQPTQSRAIGAESIVSVMAKLSHRDKACGPSEAHSSAALERTRPTSAGDRRPDMMNHERLFSIMVLRQRSKTWLSTGFRSESQVLRVSKKRSAIRRSANDLKIKGEQRLFYLNDYTCTCTLVQNLEFAALISH